MNVAANFLAIDLGTTHLKAAIVDQGGRIVADCRLPTKTLTQRDGSVFYDAAQFWETTVTVIHSVYHKAPVPLGAVCITGMAETGLLLNARTGEICSDLIPWFDRSGQDEVYQYSQEHDARERFYKTGLRPSNKYGFFKLKWLQRRGVDLHGKTWLSAPDYIGFRLTGRMCTDPTLAARTYVYSLPGAAWDSDFIEQNALPPELFPPVLPSGTPMGYCLFHDQLPFLKGVPVSICGHDHVVATMAMGGLLDGSVLNSVGTAEVLLGILPNVRLTDQHYKSGLSFGPHVLADNLAWMGGLSAAGGSIEWIRGVLSEPELSYEQVMELVKEPPSKPSGIIYQPFLSGSGAPWPDSFAKGAFIGLQREHTRSHLLQAVFEGISMAMHHIGLAASRLTEKPINDVFVAGGGTKNDYWLQTKADVFGYPLTVLKSEEASLVGAALLGGLKNGLLSCNDLATILDCHRGRVFLPNRELHTEYQWVFNEGYVKLQQPIREYYQKSKERWR